LSQIVIVNIADIFGWYTYKHNFIF